MFLLRSIVIGFATSVFLHAPEVRARTWYILPDGSGDAPTIQAGVDSAAAGDDVLVGAGTYTWSNQATGPNDDGRPMIHLRYGIRLHSESGAAVTVLDAAQEGRVVLCMGCTGIEGFTITGGKALESRGSLGGAGGGIWVYVGEPVIADNIIRDNYASFSGGGIAVHYTRGIVIRTNSVLWNAAGYRTGGIELYSPDSLSFVQNNTLLGNLGGGITCLWSRVKIERNIIAESGLSTEWRIGGYAVFCVDSLPELQCNILWDNAGGDIVCGTDLGGNRSDDPRFCASDPGGTGLRLLRPDSPALPENNSCGVLIGAAGVGCDVTDASSALPMRPALRVSPNPPVGVAAITYALARGSTSARLAVYDLRGRLVARILETGRASATGTVTWGGRDDTGAHVAAGVYIVRLETDASSAATKLVWVR